MTTKERLERSGGNKVYKWDLCIHLEHNMHYIHIYIYIQGVSGGIVNILGGGSMDYSE